ncbi:hypothetical protein ACWEPB_37020 [Kitasatospora cineracea]
MNTDQIIATVAAGGGVAAAGVAWWQATIARGQARDAQGAQAQAVAAAATATRHAAAAEQQAQAAQEQAAAARDQVRAAEEQVAVLRRQLDAQQEHHREASGPQFEVKYRGASHSGAQPGQRLVRFDITQTTGVALARILVTVAGPNVNGLLSGPSTIVGQHDQPGPMATGGTFTVDVAVDPTVMAPIPVIFTFDATGQDQGTQWRRSTTGTVLAYSRISSPTAARRRLGTP